MMPQNEVVHLCPGEQHSLNWSTSQDYLYWKIITPSQIIYQNKILFVSTRVGNYPRHISGTTVNVIKISEPGVLPVTSMLQIDHVTISINGSVITCYSHGDVLTISIHVINNGKWNLCKRQNSLINYFIKLNL